MRNNWGYGAGALLAQLAATAAHAQSLNGPSMTAPLALPSKPFTLDTGPFGTWSVDAAISGIGLWQDNRTSGDHAARVDLASGLVFIQKSDGVLQFFLAAGGYTFPTLGTPYTPITRNLGLTYTAVPEAYLKIAPTDSFSIIAGRLPSLIGAEQAFTFENMNIERGLLWAQEPTVSQGVQANYTVGPVAFSLSLNDGYYSNRYNWLSGAITWTIDKQNSLEFVAGGNLGHTGTSTFATPLAQNNSAIYNLIYTYSNGPWTISPYLQISHVDANPAVGIPAGATSTSGAILATYAPGDHWSLSGRAEYIGTSGQTNLLYGPGSDAVSITATPAYRWKQFYGRAEISYVHADGITQGSGFGTDGRQTDQLRGLIEVGAIF